MSINRFILIWVLQGHVCLGMWWWMIYPNIWWLGHVSDIVLVPQGTECFHYVSEYYHFIIAMFGLFSFTPSQLYQNIGTEASLAMIGSISSSTRLERPENLLGSGPIILTSCGTSRLPMVQNLSSAFMHRHTFSSSGLPWREENEVIILIEIIEGKLYLEELQDCHRQLRADVVKNLELWKRFI